MDVTKAVKSITEEYSESIQAFVLLYTYETAVLSNNSDIISVVYSIEEAIKKKKECEAKIILPDDFCDASLNQLTEFDDYIFQKYYAKPLVIIYGNCHTTAISDYLEKCPEFCEKYALFRIKPIHTIESAAYFENAVFQHCDVFIHQSIQVKNRYGEEFASENVIKHLKSNCRIIAIPNVYGLPRCFFPQYTKDDEFKQRKGTTVFFRDCIIDSAAEKGEKITSPKYNEFQFDKKALDEALDAFFIKVGEREKDWDIKCLKFIKENYRSKRLFYDPNHPTNVLISYITEEVLSIMGIDGVSLSDVSVDALSGFEMPIIKSVKSHYGLAYNENGEMRIGSYNKVRLGKMMGIEDYIKQYYSCEWQNAKVNKRIKISSLCLFYFYKIYNIFYKICYRKS